MWSNEFKIALAQKDVDAIERLLSDIPKFENVEEAKQASFLLKNAMELLYSLQDEITSSKKQIKKNIDFLKSSLSDSRGSLNIKS